MSCPEVCLDGVMLRIFELKLPGAGDAASDDPRGPKEAAELPIVRGPLPPAVGCRPSRADSILVFEGYEDCVYNDF